jgi:gliding motility-associated-like protein
MRRVKKICSILNNPFILLRIVITYCWINSASGQCPPNIGFEKGSFENWVSLKGIINPSGNISMNIVSPDPENHVILSADKDGKLLDEYGGFPVISPNGSSYSVKLGMSAGGRDAHGLNYTFTVPKTSGDYSIIYNYAVVLENPTHQPHEQPLFSVKVFNVTDNKYESCGSFQFIAAADLPGFKLSKAGRPNVYYKDWAPITLKLPGFEDKVLRLEFTINDCTLGGHFGYAYIDINENCTTPITGNVFCTDVTNLTLTAPYGFQGYRWFTEDFSTKLGEKNTLKLNPAPPQGTRLALEINPFPNQGCLDTLYTTITKSLDPFVFNVTSDIDACKMPGLDLTHSDVTKGSTPNMTYTYFKDFDESVFVTNPKAIVNSSTYYIKASNKAGCTDTKPVNVVIRENPVIRIPTSIAECTPNIVNLRDPALVAGNRSDLTYSFWEDVNTIQPLLNASAITKTGTYFIQASDPFKCFTTQAINVSITPPPLAVVNNPLACGSLALFSANIAVGSDPSASVSYWTDGTATVNRLPESHLFTNTTKLFVKITSIGGCSVIRPATVTIHPYPDFTVVDPHTVKIPKTINLTTMVPFSQNWIYTYWEDSAATKTLFNPERIIKSGKYFVKATSNEGCTVVQPINVTIDDADILPSNIFSPNGDGINDYWLIPLIEYYPESTIEIFTRNGQSIYRSKGYTRVWDGRANDGNIVPVGVYYYLIKASPRLKPVSGTVTVIY